MKKVFFFFFSSRRRHTRWNCDWSSDVCSSDLRRWPGAVSRRTSAASWPPRRSRTPPPTTSRWRPGSRRPTHPTRPRGTPAGPRWRRPDVLRYGENPHQRGALYTNISAERAGVTRRAATGGPETGIAAAELLHGKAMSYNNYVDADAARRSAG